MQKIAHSLLENYIKMGENRGVSLGANCITISNVTSRC